MNARRRGVAVLVLAGTVALCGCSIRGSQTLPTPFVKGEGSGSYTVTVEMADVANLVRHAEVKVDDVTVGTIKSMKVDGWHATVTIGLKKDVKLPANAVAKIGQKSLLGAEYLDLSAPTGTAPTGQLHDGSVIPLDQTSRYPETEEVLAALSTVLNGSGLAQVHTIATELNQVLSGRQQDTRALLTNLNTFVGGLDGQKSDIVAAIDHVNTLAASLGSQNQVIGTAIDKIGPGLAALEDNRVDLTNTLTALSHLGDVATQVINASQQDLVGTLHDLQPALKALADTGQDLPESIGELATYPFPLDNVTRTFRGDYSNIFVNLDLRCSTLTRNFLSGAPVVGGLDLCSPLGLLTNPLKAPLEQTPAPKADASTPPPTPSATAPLGGLLGDNDAGTGSSGGLLGSLLGSLTGGGR
ncbi:MAG TPA: MCE family protein [Mycobacteriales bacterium]|jgi:phospholipid/cholesterol/gamma-HCH transport system substrate-binding protein|nr:MCE family protein [Mycobacteriales bacterium]